MGEEPPGRHGTLALPGVRFVSVCSPAFANNVAVDVNACSYNESDQAVNIARQIAAKVPT
jgi:hypothetical protein